MAISFVDKIRKANDLIDEKKLVDVEFGGIFSGYPEFQIEFLQDDKLYQVKVTNIDCKKKVPELAELIAEKIKTEKYEV